MAAGSGHPNAAGRSRLDIIGRSSLPVPPVFRSHSVTQSGRKIAASRWDSIVSASDGFHLRRRMVTVPNGRADPNEGKGGVSTFFAHESHSDGRLHSHARPLPCTKQRMGEDRENVLPINGIIVYVNAADREDCTGEQVETFMHC